MRLLLVRRRVWGPVFGYPFGVTTGLRWVLTFCRASLGIDILFVGWGWLLFGAGGDGGVEGVEVEGRGRRWKRFGFGVEVEGLVVAGDSIRSSDAATA